MSRLPFSPGPVSRPRQTDFNLVAKFGLGLVENGQRPVRVFLSSGQIGQGDPEFDAIGSFGDGFFKDFSSINPFAVRGQVFRLHDCQIGGRRGDSTAFGQNSLYFIPMATLLRQAKILNNHQPRRLKGRLRRHANVRKRKIDRLLAAPEDQKSRCHAFISSRRAGIRLYRLTKSGILPVGVAYLPVGHAETQISLQQ